MSNTYFESFQALQTRLLARMSERGDLPGFSRSVQSIVNVLSDSAEEDRDDMKLIQIVLTDASLTQKVLRLANSAMYAVFEGQVTTVSRAVAILGIQTVAHLALGLKVVESFQSDDRSSAAIRGEMQKSMLAGVLGRQFASVSAGTRDAEEASVCSVLHGLGRMLISFYLPESWAEIELAVKRGQTEQAAAEACLCVGFEAVGQLIASRWGLPAKLVNTLRPAEAVPAGVETTHDDWLCAIGSVASKGARIMFEAAEDDTAGMTALLTAAAPLLGVEVSQLQAAVTSARTVVRETMSGAEMAGQAQAFNREKAISSGLVELRESAKTATLSQTVAQAVEFLHQALGGSRSFYFLRAAKERAYKARLGLGKGAVDLLPSLRFEEQFKPDVFHAAMASEKACYIENTRAPTIKSKLPMWWMASLNAAQSFSIIPMNSNRMPLGFIYIEWGSNGESVRKLDDSCTQAITEVRAIISQSIERSRMAASMALQANAL